MIIIMEIGKKLTLIRVTVMWKEESDGSKGSNGKINRVICTTV
jgi:hypothetical protein